MEIDFSTLFTDGASTLEIYLCPEDSSRPSGEDGGDVSVGWPAKTQTNLRYGATVNAQEFYYKDLVCTYDKSNDSQRVVRRVMTKNMIIGNLYMAVFIEDIVPAYMFPTTRDIAHTTDVARRSARINNRLFITNDRDSSYDYFYIKYVHSDNVDVTKMKTDLNAAIQKLCSIMHT